jgi:hypothetical protein
MPDFEEMRKAVDNATEIRWCKNCGIEYDSTKVDDDCWECWSSDSLVDDSEVGDANFTSYFNFYDDENATYDEAVGPPAFCHTDTEFHYTSGFWQMPAPSNQDCGGGDA